MAKGWNCPRCSTANDEAALTCSNCGFIRGGVVVPGSYTPPPKPVPGPDERASAEAPTAFPPAAPPEPPSGAPTGVGWAAIPAAPSATSGPGAPQPATSIWRRIPLQVVILAVLIAAGAIGAWYFNASRSASGEISKGGDLTVTELRVGDCWDTKDPSTQSLSDVTARPCNEPHEYEVFFSGSIEGNVFPIQDTFDAYYTANCDPAFEKFVGMAYADSKLEILAVRPTSDSWDDGDRVIQCSVHHPDNPRLTESLKGSNQ